MITMRREARKQVAVGLALLGISLAGCSAPGSGPWRGAEQGPTYGAIAGRGQHMVIPGETLSHIAIRYGVSVAALARANGINDPDRIFAGRVLRVPDGGDGGARVARADARRTNVGPGEAGPGAIAANDGWHVVRPGESVALIAQRHGLRTGDVVAANDLANPHLVRPGQRLLLPERDEPTRVAAPRVVEDPARAEAKRRAALIPPPPLSGRGFMWPVSGRVLSGFGADPEGVRNDGINIAAAQGAPVRAAEHGIVVYAGEELPGYGRMILLRHAEGYLTTYAHNAALLVDIGDRVERGQPIARVGATGRVSEPQLHFALREGRRPIDPKAHLTDDPTTVASRD
jgi:murein DD-endopeptidase MepM/ murein hydrolase activator NlpD